MPVNIRYDIPKVNEEVKCYNSLTLVTCKLPLVDNFKHNVKHISKFFTGIKNSFEPFSNFIISSFGISVFPEWLFRIFMHEYTKKTTIVFTNVIGPRYPIIHNGHKSKKLYASLIAGGSAGTGLAVISHNGILKMTLTTDEARMKDPSYLMKML